MDYKNPYPKNSNVAQDGNLEIEGNFIRFKPMVQPSDVLKFGLVGIPKRFPLTNEPITEEYIANHLEASISELEMMGLILSAAIFHHVDDLYDGGLGSNRFFPTMLKKYPVREIITIGLRYPNAQKDNPSLIYEIPADWITFENNKVNVIATTGFLAPHLVQGAGNIPLVNMFHSSYKPSGYRIDYKAGFEQDQLPVIVWQLIIDMTTVAILTEIGPLLFSNTGISVGIDGVTQSAQLPGPKIFEARILSLMKKIEKNRNLIASYYGAAIDMEFLGL